MRVSSPYPSPTPHLPDAVEQRRLCSEQHRVHAHDEGERVLQQAGGQGRQGGRAGRGGAGQSRCRQGRPTGDARSGKTWPKKEGARLASAPQMPAKAECSLNTVGSSKPMKGLSAIARNRLARASRARESFTGGG